MSADTEHIVEFTLIYNRYKMKVFNYLFKMTANQDLSEDIVQNTFLKLFENFDSITNIKSVSFGIFKTARNDLYKHFRKKKVIKENQTVVAETFFNNGNIDLNEMYELKEMNILVMRMLENYPEEQKDTYLLREYGGLSYSEIASVTEVEEKTVKSRLYEVRKKLIKQLSKVI